MARNAAVEQTTVDPVELSRTMVDIARKSQELVRDFLAREQSAQHIPLDDALHMSGLFQQLAARIMANPLPLAQVQIAFWQDYMTLINNTALRFLGHNSDPLITPAKGDNRWKHESWEQSPIFDFIKQSYLLAADYVHSSTTTCTATIRSRSICCTGTRTAPTCRPANPATAVSSPSRTPRGLM